MNAPATPTSLITSSLLNLNIEDHSKLVLSINLCVLLIILFVIICIKWIIPKILKEKYNKKIRQFKLEGIKFGLKDVSCEFICDAKVEEIAYKLWIELRTRKIALPVDKNDVIVEIYNSWYEAFKSIRELLKGIPGNYLGDASKLIEVTIQVLNEGLRPHLTKWQARFRTWYNSQNKDNKEAPQDIQEKYKDYQALWDDLIETNNNMMAFANELKLIAFGDKVVASSASSDTGTQSDPETQSGDQQPTDDQQKQT